jgi:hypothetical protein
MIFNMAVSKVGSKCVTKTLSSEVGGNTIQVNFNGYGEYIVVAPYAIASYNGQSYDAPAIGLKTSALSTGKCEKLANGVWRVFAMRGSMQLTYIKPNYGIALSCIVIGDWSDEEAPTFS